MKTQNDINKQFSENNNASFGHFVTLMGSLIAIISLYVKVISKANLNEIVFLFVAIITVAVFCFLACLSAFFGYSRRRDHLVACASDNKDLYPILCGNGTGKKYLDFMVGAYPLFYFLFIISILLVTIFSVLVSINMGYNFCPICVIIILGILSCMIAVLYYCRLFKKYKSIKESVVSYSSQKP